MKNSLPDWVDKMRRCDGKDKLSKAAADQRAATIRHREVRSRRGVCEAYLCKYCDSWHIGHSRVEK